MFSMNMNKKNNMQNIQKNIVDFKTLFVNEMVELPLITEEEVEIVEDISYILS